MKSIRSVFLVAIFTFSLFSCGAEKKEIVIPENIIQKEEFSKILVDLLIIEGYRTRVTRSNENKNEQMRSFYAGAFEKHKVSKEDFDKSYDFYRDHPDLLEELTRNAEKQFKNIEDRVVDERNKNGAKEEEDKTPRKKILIPGRK